MKYGDFKATCILEDTWLIQGEGCDSYLLIGEKEAIMVDSGCDANKNIRKFAQTLTDKPLRKVINTHSHFDHTGGNGYFEEVLGTPGIAKSAKNTMDCDPFGFPLDYEFTYVSDGDTIKLGNRRLLVIVLNCHSPENLALIDPDKKILFPGDEVESGQVLLLPGFAERLGQIHSAPAASVEQYLEAMEKLNAYRDSFDKICPGHNGSPIAACYLDWYIELAKKILDGTIVGSDDCTSKSYHRNMLHFPFPHADYLRAEYKGASLVYCKDRIRKSDVIGNELPATPLHLTSAYSARQ